MSIVRTQSPKNRAKSRANRAKAGLIATLALATALSLAHAFTPEIDFNPPAYVDEMPSKEFLPAPAQAGSLFGQGDRPLFADRRAMRPNDLITINIDESSNASLSSSKDYTSTSGGAVNAPVLGYNGSDEQAAKDTQDLNNQTNYTLQKTADNSNFKGSGQQSRNDALKFSITARILKVLENGNYFVYGHNEVLIDGEKRLVTISGVIRPYDIERDNSISSKYIADSKIAYTSIGAIGQTNHKKDGTKAIEDEFPF
ncbi:flagellar basal body L-ring protein FlgH [uncultured Helicobacter sp.]|uniref:flagellar basal body L-ring protein FlgH n=1 Tax=uncultured Helicobacter sp. TaxID=175537 RepID=UPI002619B31A|nr:flagellar basal body L-ring protein FlgH [uncultured Helicobacter sp.]